MSKIALKNHWPRPTSAESRLAFTWVRLFVCLATIGVLLALLLPATRRARPAAYRMQCSNNLKQIGLALLSYESTYRRLPPAYTVDSNGNRLHSWRTLILPYLEQNDLYSRVDFSKPWDDPANEAVCRELLPVYRCPSNSTQRGQTTYMVVVTANSCLQPGKGRKLADCSDPLSDTVLVYEAEPSQAVHWMSPQDADEAMFVASNENSKTAHTGGRTACFGDGSVRFLSSRVPPKILHGFITIDGGEHERLVD